MRWRYNGQLAGNGWTSPANNSAFGTKNKSLKYNPDGSLTIYLGNTSPGKDKESNWLPALAQEKKPNVVYFLVDNLGMGELSSYSGCPPRGVSTPRIDALAREGMKLLKAHFAPETQCTPSRSALMTGRYSIRSGNRTVALAGSHGGLVPWERTLGDIF